MVQVKDDLMAEDEHNWLDYSEISLNFHSLLIFDQFSFSNYLLIMVRMFLPDYS